MTLKILFALLSHGSVESWAQGDCGLQATPAAINACEIEYRTFECEALKQSLPEEDKALIKSCQNPSHVSGEVGAAMTMKACASAFGDSIVDLVTLPFTVLAWLTSGEPPPPRIRAQLSLYENCKTIDCKYQFLGPYKELFTKEEIEGHPPKPGVDCRDIVARNYCEGFSLAVLLRQIPERVAKKKSSLPRHINPWDRENDLESIELSFSEKKDQILNDLFQKLECYSPAARREMQCYGLFMVVDPAATLGLVAKISRLKKYKLNPNSKVIDEARAFANRADEVCDFCHARNFTDHSRRHIEARHISARNPDAARLYNEMFSGEAKKVYNDFPPDLQRVLRDFSKENHGSTSLFPPIIGIDDVERAFRNLPASKIEIKSEILPTGFQKVKAEMNIYGDKYEVEIQVCRAPVPPCRDNGGRTYTRDEVMTIIPKCGPMVVNLVPTQNGVRIQHKVCAP